MCGSSRLNICACWKGLIRPCGDSMKTVMPARPRMAYSAAEPVSPDVAPRMVSTSPRRANSYSNSWPSSCMAMSLNAAVGPSDRWASHRSSESSVTGTTTAPNTSGA